MAVLARSFCAADAMAGYVDVRSLSFRDSRRTASPLFNSNARYPSHFTSYVHCSPSGNLSVSFAIIGGMNEGEW